MKQTTSANKKLLHQNMVVSDPEDFVAEIFANIDPASLSSTYKIDDWSGGVVGDFLDKLARKTGKLLKKGQPDAANAAKMVVRDWQKGKLRTLQVVQLTQKSSKKVVTSVDATAVVQLDCGGQVNNAKKAEEEQHQPLSCKEKRAKDRAERPKKCGSNFYEQTANAKNRRNRPTNSKNKGKSFKNSVADDSS